jgi:hypothetical protein
LLALAGDSLQLAADIGGVRLVMTKETDGSFTRALSKLIKIANSRPVIGPNKDAVPDPENNTYNLIKDADMVFAIWEDANRPLGYNAILVKGYDRLRELNVLLAQPRECVWPWDMTAIKCVDEDWAIRLGDLVQKFFPDNPARYFMRW